MEPIEKAIISFINYHINGLIRLVLTFLQTHTFLLIKSTTRTFTCRLLYVSDSPLEILTFDRFLFLHALSVHRCLVLTRHYVHKYKWNTKHVSGPTHVRLNNWRVGCVLLSVIWLFWSWNKTLNVDEFPTFNLLTLDILNNSHKIFFGYFEKSCLELLSLIIIFFLFQ